MTGPFAGVTVLEIGQFVVVPFCSQMMADMGAHVVKVEPRTGDAYRSWNDGLGETESRQFLIKNRGKESVAVDLAHPRANEAIEALVRAADVVMVNLSPSAVRRRGLDYESLRAVNPRIVYGAATAYGSVGPEADLPGMDVVVQARSGLLSSLGAETDGVPTHSEVQAADYSAALLLLGGVSAALYVRERTGQGQRVDVSLLGGALALQNNSLGHVHAHDGWRERFVRDELPRMRRAGSSRAEVESARRAARPDPPRHTAHYRVFRTADGFLALGAGSQHARRRLCEAAGLPAELADRDPDELGRQLERVLRGRNTANWSEKLVAAAVPVATVHHVDELLLDEHAMTEELIADYDHPEIGRYRGLGRPIRMSGTPLASAGPSPSFAAHTTSALIDAGLGADVVADLVACGAVVDGRVPAASTSDPRST